MPLALRTTIIKARFAHLPSSPKLQAASGRELKASSLELETNSCFSASSVALC
jgi:hypothetical protein